LFIFCAKHSLNLVGCAIVNGCVEAVIFFCSFRTLYFSRVQQIVHLF